MRMGFIRNGLVRSVVLIVLSVTTTLSIGCASKDDSEPGKRVVPELPTYDKQNCNGVQPYDGTSAPSENHSETSISTDPAFGKKYDRADLNALLTASAVQTSFYVVDMGLNVYKIPRVNARQCPMYYVLPEAPAYLRNFWDEIAGGAGEGQLAGAYFEVCEGDCPDYSIVNPTILVHEASDRWTLVHEMMHHNFNVLRKADRTKESLLKVRNQLAAGKRQAEELYFRYNSNPNRADLAALGNQLYLMVGNLYVLLVNTSFEEMSIENLLMIEYGAKRLKYVSKESAQSALWYIRYSRKDGMKQFDGFTDLLRFIRTEANRNEWRDILTTAERSSSEIDYIRRKTGQVEDQAEQRLMQIQAQLNPGQPLLQLEPKSTKSMEMHLNHINGYEYVKEFAELMADLNSKIKN